jgi:hypothetical protein
MVFFFFNLLDRAFDRLAQAFDWPSAPADRRARPQVVLFLLALALVPCVVLLSWEWSPWMLGVLGLLGTIVCLGLFAAWSR